MSDEAGKIAPIEIVLLDELNLPLTMPSLQLFFAGNRFAGRCVALSMNEPENLILGDKARAVAISMLFEASVELLVTPMYGVP
jgi:hypothetical protein